MIKAGIVGVSGYSGLTALKLLLNHPDVRITYLSANNTTGKITDIWPELNGRIKLMCTKYESKKAIKLCDLIFLAVPHTTSMKLAPELVKAGKRVIDLSGDYRLTKKSVYKKWYGAEHTDPLNLKKAVYGLPELYREDIKKAKLVSNPGCYPTAAILGIAPLIATHSKKITSIIIDAKSGVSGAGKKVSASYIFTEVNENFKAYKILKHQHAPEIDTYLSKISKQDISVNFVPHLLPVNRGILETIYIQLNNKLPLNYLLKMYNNFYKTEPFVRVLSKGAQPELKNVIHTNFCDIGIEISNDKKLIVITSAIDNLLKGAAGQAVQNMNIMYGFKETESL